ncbi:hypothetical protein KY345_06640 [Candidatus Woesearchaeota archaeon]|nr:hypothetical protein [Candidatus Woesearchaeota archaeon]
MDAVKEWKKEKEVINMAKYKLKKQILEEQGNEVKEGAQVKLKLVDEEITGIIAKIEEDQVFIEG